MTEIDPRFGRPRHTDDPANELSHASDEVLNEWTKGIQQSVKTTFRSIYGASEQISDQFTAMFGQDIAFKHSQEIQQTAQKSLDHGDTEGAKHLLKRDIRFSEWTLGYDNDQSANLRWQLDKLEAGDTKPSEASKDNNNINSFEDLFRRQ